MRTALIRLVTLLIPTLAAALLAAPSRVSLPVAVAAGAALGALAAGADRLVRGISSPRVAGAVSGALVGLIAAALVRAAAGPAFTQFPQPLVAVLLVTGFALAGAAIGAERFERHGVLPDRLPASGRPSGSVASVQKIVDTSVIIDGRIADIAAAGFVEGVIVIPQFILKELQQVADASDALKRNRGRKGLDVLRELQASDRVKVEFTAEDNPDIREVDTKLLWLAERRGARVLTNDYNLNKVAQLRGIEVVNVNDLANSVRPVVLPGESLNVQIIKEGKERNQGVGYLDDGTMVVVDNGKRYMGQRFDVLVTSVIQTNAGKMIFASADDDEAVDVRPRVLRRTADPKEAAVGDKALPRMGEA